MINYYEGGQRYDVAEFEKWERQQAWNKTLNTIMQLAAMAWFMMVSFAMGLVFYYEFMG